MVERERGELWVVDGDTLLLMTVIFKLGGGMLWGMSADFFYSLKTLGANSY